MGKTILLTTILAAVALTGCKKSSSEKDGTKTATAASSGAPQDEAKRSLVLATVNGVTITVGEFQDRINRQSPYIRARYTSVEQKLEFLDNLVRFEVLAAQAKKRGLDKDADVVRTMKQVMIQKLMKQKFDSSIGPDDVSEEEMRAFFEANPADYKKPEEVRVSAIILDDEASAKLVAVLALGEEGSSNKGFRELVAQHSTDEETKLRGGDLRYFKADTTDLPKAAVEAAFGLAKTGDVVGPIAADKRYYIFKQTGRRKAIDKTFEQVKRQLQNRLYRDKRTQAQKDFVDGLKKNASIEIFKDNLEKVQVDTSKATGNHPNHLIPPDGHDHGAH